MYGLPSDTQVRGGFHRKLDAEVVVLYRNDWVASVARKRGPESLSRNDSWVCFRALQGFAVDLPRNGPCCSIVFEYRTNMSQTTDSQVDRHVPQFFLPRMGVEPEQDRYKGIFVILKNFISSSAKPKVARLENGKHLKPRPAPFAGAFSAWSMATATDRSGYDLHHVVPVPAAYALSGSRLRSMVNTFRVPVPPPRRRATHPPSPSDDQHTDSMSSNDRVNHFWSKNHTDSPPHRRTPSGDSEPMLAGPSM